MLIFVRAVTCVQAYVGEHVNSKHFEEAAKQLCEKVPLLRDVKPPLWPDEIEFSYWASAKHLLLKRYSNVKSSSKKGKRPEPAISDETDQSTEDVSIKAQQGTSKRTSKQSGELESCGTAAKSYVW